MLRLQDLFSRIPGTFSMARPRSIQHADDSPELQSQSKEDADAEDQVDGTGAEQAQRQEISAFMPLSRWIAKVQSPGSGRHNA